MSQHTAPPITLHRSDHGVVTLLLDAPDSPVNTVTVAYIEALGDCVERLEAMQDDIAGVVIRSAKKSFLAGGDLNRLMAVDPQKLDEFVADIDFRKSLLRRLELLRAPVVAVINGSVLGGGLELALACHHSIAIKTAQAVAGLPESTLGLMPGAGGIVRVVDRLGIDRALDEVIIPGTRFGLQEALDIGLIDEIVDSAGDAIQAAVAWMAAHRDSPQRVIVRPPSQRRDLPPATPVPINRAITVVANAVLDHDFEAALHAESVAFGAIVANPGAKNSIRLNFFDSGALRKRARALSDEPLALVTIEPTNESNAASLAVLAGRKIIVSDIATESTRSGNRGTSVPDAGCPDARIVLDGIDREGWPMLWLAGDTVGDGQQVLEYVFDGSEAASAAVAGLASAGIVPVRVDPTVGPLTRIMAAALDQAVIAHKSAGAGDEQIAGALAWVGLTKAARALVPGAQATSVECELASDLLDAISEAAVKAFGDTESPLDNVTSVRAGGFPGWTGGVRAWRESGRELARELAANESLTETEVA